MNVFLNEIYKVFIKRRFLLVFILVMIIQVATFNVKPQFINLRSNKLYSQKIDILLGPYETENVKFVSEEVTRKLDIYDKYLSSGSSSKLTEELTLIADEFSALSLLSSQIDYVSQSKENRYFMEINGWYNLLVGFHLDYIFAFLIIVICSSSFTYEHETRMEELNVSTLYGRNNRTIKQSLVIFSGLSFLLILISFLKFFKFFDIFYPSLHFPIQSVPLFAYTPFNLTLIQTFILLIIIKIIGVLFLLSIIRLFGKVLKSSVLTIFFSIFIVIFPYFVLNRKTLNSLPFPTTWLMASGLIQGPSYSNPSTTYPSISKEVLFIQFALICVIIILLWILTIDIRKRKYTVLLACLLLLGGCTQSQTATYNVNSNKDAFIFEKEGKIIYLDKIWNVFDLEDKVSTPLNLRVTDQLKNDGQGGRIQWNVYPNSKGVYLFRKTGVFNDHEWILEEISLEQKIPRKIADTDPYTLLQSDIPDDNFQLNFFSSNLETLDSRNLMQQIPYNNYIYHLSNQGLYRTNYFGTGKEDIPGRFSPSSYQIAFQGNNLYYIDDSLVLNRMNLDSFDSDKLVSDVISFHITEDGLFYSNYGEGNLSSYDVETGQSRNLIIGLHEVDDIRSDNKTVFYIENRELKSYNPILQTTSTVAKNVFRYYLLDDQVFILTYDSSAFLLPKADS